MERLEDERDHWHREATVRSKQITELCDKLDSEWGYFRQRFVTRFAELSSSRPAPVTDYGQGYSDAVETMQKALRDV
jgi:hypothetical protein